jgi:pilus assembly protein Flp/PilA
MRLLRNFLAADDGATAIEYALLASLLGITLVTVLTTLGTKLSSEFSEVSSALK